MPEKAGNVKVYALEAREKKAEQLLRLSER
jgi:hypothetical protein